MSYQSRIRDIQSAFVMGYHDRETCIEMFESLLKEFGFLPPTEAIDRAITNENFLALLKAAKEHRDLPSQGTVPSPAERAVQQLSAISRSLGDQPNYSMADAIKQRCPVCQKPVQALFNRVQSLDQQFIPVDPPRCQECMMKWIEEHFGLTPGAGGKLAERLSFVDRSPASPMKPDEADFFAEYEKQMEKPLEP